jgi:hypothetical protein
MMTIKCGRATAGSHVGVCACCRFRFRRSCGWPEAPVMAEAHIVNSVGHR